MSEKLEPKWLDLTNDGALFEEQLDDNALPGASDDDAYRHRRAGAGGQPAGPWQPGRAPD